MTHQYLVRERQPEIDSQDAISAAEMAELHAHIATVREHYRNRRGPAAREWEFDTDPKTLTFEAMGEIGGERFADIRRREIAAAVDLQPVDVDEGRIVCTLKLASMPLAIVDHVYTSAGRRDEWQIVYMKGRGRWWQTHNIQMSYALRPFAAEIEPFVAAEGFGQRMERNSCFRRLVFDAP